MASIRLILLLCFFIQVIYGESTIDKFGVERTSEVFKRRPSLFLNVTRDLYEKNPFANPVETAEQLLAGDMQMSDKLRITWDISVNMRPTFTSVELAALAYSIQEPEFLFRHFNDITSTFRDNMNYADYPYKGFFALLDLGMRPYDSTDFEQLYRGVSYKQEAEVGQYIRFNRFLSASRTFQVAQNFAGKSGSLFLIRGNVTANPIVFYSAVPEEDEYLLRQDTQFLITDVQSDFLLPNGNRTKLITMVTVDYDN